MNLPILSQIIILLLACISNVVSFTHTSSYASNKAFIKCMPRTIGTNTVARRMVDDKVDSAEEKAVVPKSGNYYDDEFEPAEKIGISNTMKERLMREASTGLDPEQKNTNVILYIIGAIAILVLLGGQGILY